MSRDRELRESGGELVSLCWASRLVSARWSALALLLFFSFSEELPFGPGISSSQPSRGSVSGPWMKVTGVHTTRKFSHSLRATQLRTVTREDPRLKRG